jgi:ankyrin repeat protein
LTVGVSKLEVGAKAHQTVTVQLEAPVGSTSTAWTIDTAAVEALLGLWVWSITEPISRTPASHRSTGSDEVRRPSNSARIVATGDGDEHWGRRTNVETELWMLLGSDTPTLKTAKVRVAAQSEYGIVNMWPLHDSSSKEGGEIWQHTPPPGVHPSQGRALFGWQRADSSAREPGADNRTYTIQYVDVTTPILNICAQEIYTSLIASIASSASFAGLDLTFSGKGADRRLVSDRFSAIRDSFVEQSLGTTSDAVLCLLSAFRTKLQINPTQEDVLEIVMECLTTTDWKAMELFLRWAVIVFEGDDLKRIIRATAEFYRRAMVQQRQVDFCSEGIRWLASKVPNSFLGEDGIIRGHEAVIRRVKERGFPEFTPQELLAATGLTYDHSNRNFDRVPDDDDDDAKCNRMLTALYLLCGTPMLATEAREQMDDDEKRFLIRALGRSFENSAASPATLWSSIALSITWAFSKAPLSYFFNDSYFRDAISGVPTSDISPVGNAVLLDDHDLAYLLRRLGAYSRLENGLENGLASRWFGDEDAVSQAARKGSLRMIHLLLPCGTPVEKEIFAFQQLLLSSARTGNLPDLKYAVAGLQRRDGKIDVRDGDSQTALSIAARRGDAASVEYLLSLGNGVVDPCSRDNTRTTPLSWALKGSSPIYDLDTNLLYCSSAWRQSQHKTGSFHRVQYKEDILYAMPKDFDAVLKALINTAHFSRREKLWVADSEGRTPVSLAALTGSAKLTEEICEAFRTAVATGVVDDDQADSSHRTPLSLAAKAGHAEVVKYLLSRRSCRPNMADLRGHTALHLAASSDTGEAALEVLLESRRVDPNIKDMEGRTPLCLAAQQARPASVKALLKRKDVDISMADHVGRTPLSHAAEGPLGSMVAASWQAARRLRKTVAVLMEHCSEEDLNAEDVDGLTPLFWAIKGGNLPAINLLVRDERVWLPGPGDEDWDGRQLVDVASKKTLDFLLRLGVWKTWEEEGEDGAPYWAVVEEPEIAPPEAVAEYLEEESDADEASSAGEEGVDADPEDAHSSEGSAGTGPREQNPTMGDTEETGEEENTAPDTEGIEGPEHVLGAEREDDEEQKNTAAGDKGAKGHDQESVAEKTAGEEVKRNEEGG